MWVKTIFKSSMEDTAQPENISDLIPRARKIEFESCKLLKKRPDSELLQQKWTNNSSDGDFFFFETFWANSSGGFDVQKL